MNDNESPQPTFSVTLNTTGVVVDHEQNRLVLHIPAAPMSPEFEKTLRTVYGEHSDLAMLTIDKLNEQVALLRMIRP